MNVNLYIMLELIILDDPKSNESKMNDAKHTKYLDMINKTIFNRKKSNGCIIILNGC